MKESLAQGVGDYAHKWAYLNKEHSCRWHILHLLEEIVTIKKIERGF